MAQRSQPRVQEDAATSRIFHDKHIKHHEAKGRGLEALPHQELVIKALEEKRWGRELVSALQLDPCMGERLKNSFVCILTHGRTIY